VHNNTYDSIWKGATGTNAWNYNVTEPNGTHVDGHPPYLFESGTATSVANGTGQDSTITDNTKNWTTNQWQNYEIRNPANGKTWLITGNNNHTLTLRQWGDGCCLQTWNVGETYEIHRCLQVLDQPGAGQSDLISGDNPTAFWPHQVREGCYSWNNVYTPNGHHINRSPSSPGLLEHRDYLSNTPMPGYTPYTYPHPLVSDEPPQGAEGGSPDYVLYNVGTNQTVIWYMNNNIHVTAAYGPTLPVGWQLIAVADFNLDGHADYLLFNPATRHTAIWYMNNNIHVTGANGPTLPTGWQVVGAADFNRDGHPDYLLFNSTSGATVIWYMNNNVHVTGASGPALPAG
jgi:hypothetical protein